MIFVGGEFYYSDKWYSDQSASFPKTDCTTYFLNGGQACLRVIGDYLVDHGINRILLPAYLCPTITHSFQQCGIKCDFYRITNDFSIDLEDLSRQIERSSFRAVYFINYFGFSQPDEVIKYLNNLRQQEIIIVEDNAQAGFSEKTVGDFVFNSLRKLCPYDGAYLIAPELIDKYIARYHGRVNHRLPLIRKYREGLSCYLHQEKGDPDELDDLFHRSEFFYQKDQVVEGDLNERDGIEHQDWQGICHIRRSNYNYLLNQIKDTVGILPLFPALQEQNMPMGLPVIFSGISRDKVNETLGNSQIGMTIHWEKMHGHPFTLAQKQAVEMSRQILTLTIDQYTTKDQLDYLVRILKTAILEI